jgi:hypothetical protein
MALLERRVFVAEALEFGFQIFIRHGLSYFVVVSLAVPMQPPLKSTEQRVRNCVEKS